MSQDYVSITLTDEQEPYQPRERLERLFSRILEVKIDNTRTSMLTPEAVLWSWYRISGNFSSFFPAKRKDERWRREKNR